MGQLELPGETMTITETSLTEGTEGLHARLDRTLIRNGLATNELIQWCIPFGLGLHENDRRSRGQPYNDHLLRVALIGIEILRITDPEIVVSFLLHDSIEDHANEIIELLSQEKAPDDPIESREKAHLTLSNFATRKVGNFVLAVSNPILPPHQAQDRNVKNRAYFKHTKKLTLVGPPEPRALKLPDFHDNTWAPEGVEDPDKRRRLDIKHLGIYDLHIAGLNRPDSLVVGDARDEVIDTLSERRSQALDRLREAA
jgi:hypothetical protein